MSAAERLDFEVRLRSRRVQRELDRLTEPDYRRVLRELRGLARDPRPVGCKKLYDDVYRVRVGDWRVVYASAGSAQRLIDEEKGRIEVGGIRRRREGTYKGIEELFGD